MSWSVNSTGSPAEVRGQLSEQFKGPLAEKPRGLSDDGERETVQKIAELIEQILSTFDPGRNVSISASGHIVFGDWENKTGGYQTVNLTVIPRS